MIKIIVLIMILIIISCDQTNENSNTELNLSFSLNGSLPIKSAKGKLYGNSADTTFFRLNIEDTTGNFHFTHVNPGNWDLEVFAYSDTVTVDTLLRYYLKRNETITAGIVNDIKLVLQPVSGALTIDVNW